MGMFLHCIWGSLNRVGLAWTSVLECHLHSGVVLTVSFRTRISVLKVVVCAESSSTVLFLRIRIVLEYLFALRVVSYLSFQVQTRISVLECRTAPSSSPHLCCSAHTLGLFWSNAQAWVVSTVLFRIQISLFWLVVGASSVSTSLSHELVCSWVVVCARVTIWVVLHKN
jgi:hypothetical protein